MKRIVLTLLLIGSFLVSTARAQYWQWTPRREHHQAVVSITSHGMGTSGTYVRLHCIEGVVTCKHGLAGGKATVSFASGERQTGSYTVDKYNYDLAFIFVKANGVKPTFISPRAPQANEEVEFVSYGGPLTKLRHWKATYTGKRSGEYAVYATHVIQGDSGCGVFNKDGYLIGVQNVGMGTAGKTSVGGWDVYYPAGCVPYRVIVAFCQRIHTKFG